MSAYSILTFIGCAIFIVLFIVEFFVDVPTTASVIISTVAAIIMIIGIYCRNRKK